MRAVTAGDTIRLHVTHLGRGWDLRLNDRRLGVRGFSLASGWRYILQAQVQPSEGSLMSALWLLVWLAPIGYFSDPRRLPISAALVAGAVAAAPLLLPVLNGPAPIVVAAVAVLLGGALRALIAYRDIAR